MNEDALKISYRGIHMSKYISIVGIILVMIGTILSLWSILSTKSDYVQTMDWYGRQRENFRKDKKKVIMGMILIIIGSIFQIVAMFI